jgi:hypothetical protein
LEFKADRSGGAFEIVDASISRIPCVAVGFVGYKGVETLYSRLATTEEDKRPDAALVLESGVYVGPSGSFLGAQGFFAFCKDLSFFARNVLVAEPMLDSYFIDTTTDS